MSLNPSALKTAIRNRLISELNFNLTAGQAGLFVDILIDEIISHIVNNAEVNTTLDQGLNSIFTTGIPVPQDGGAALKTAWSSATAGGAKDGASGGIT